MDYLGFSRTIRATDFSEESQDENPSEIEISRMYLKSLPITDFLSCLVPSSSEPFFPDIPSNYNLLA